MAREHTKAHSAPMVLRELQGGAVATPLRSVGKADTRQTHGPARAGTQEVPTAAGGMQTQHCAWEDSLAIPPDVNRDLTLRPGNYTLRCLPQ